MTIPLVLVVVALPTAKERVRRRRISGSINEVRRLHRATIRTIASSSRPWAATSRCSTSTRDVCTCSTGRRPRSGEQLHLTDTIGDVAVRLGDQFGVSPIDDPRATSSAPSSNSAPMASSRSTTGCRRRGEAKPGDVTAGSRRRPRPSVRSPRSTPASGSSATTPRSPVRSATSSDPSAATTPPMSPFASPPSATGRDGRSGWGTTTVATHGSRLSVALRAIGEVNNLAVASVPDELVLHAGAVVEDDRAGRAASRGLQPREVDPHDRARRRRLLVSHRRGGGVTEALVIRPFAEVDRARPRARSRSSPISLLPSTLDGLARAVAVPRVAHRPGAGRAASSGRPGRRGDLSALAGRSEHSRGAGRPGRGAPPPAGRCLRLLRSAAKASSRDSCDLVESVPVVRSSATATPPRRSSPFARSSRTNDSPANRLSRPQRAAYGDGRPRLGQLVERREPLAAALLLVLHLVGGPEEVTRRPHVLGRQRDAARQRPVVAASGRTAPARDR